MTTRPFVLMLIGPTSVARYGRYSTEQKAHEAAEWAVQLWPGWKAEIVYRPSKRPAGGGQQQETEESAASGAPDGGVGL